MEAIRKYTWPLRVWSFRWSGTQGKYLWNSREATKEDHERRRLVDVAYVERQLEKRK